MVSRRSPEFSLSGLYDELVDIGDELTVYITVLNEMLSLLMTPPLHDLLLKAIQDGTISPFDSEIANLHLSTYPELIIENMPGLQNIVQRMIDANSHRKSGNDNR